MISSLLLLAWQTYALHNPTDNNGAPDGADGNMLEVHYEEGVKGNASSLSQIPIANGLAGCKSGNFASKGANKCTGIQGLRCNADGGCAGTLQGNVYKINCNAKHECVTESWGGTMVRKFLSTTDHAGIVDWNNGCSWICEDSTPAFASTTVCNGNKGMLCHTIWCNSIDLRGIHEMAKELREEECKKWWSITSIKMLNNCHYNPEIKKCMNYVSGPNVVPMPCINQATAQLAVDKQCNRGSSGCVPFQPSEAIDCAPTGAFPNPPSGFTCAC